MAMQKIKNGGFVAEEISKVNANFTEVESNYAKKSELPTVPTNVSVFTNDAGYVKANELPTKTSDLTNDSGYITSAAVPTKTSQLTNDNGYITSADVPTKVSQLTNDAGYVKSTDATITNKVDKETGKGLSTEDYTTAEKNKLASLSAPSKVSFAAADWTNGTYTTAANNKMPAGVMRKNGSNYESVFVDVQVVGTNVVITSDEAFEGYLVLV